MGKHKPNSTQHHMIKIRRCDTKHKTGYPFPVYLANSLVSPSQLPWLSKMVAQSWKLLLCSLASNLITGLSYLGLPQPIMYLHSLHPKYGLFRDLPSFTYRVVAEQGRLPGSSCTWGVVQFSSTNECGAIKLARKKSGSCISSWSWTPSYDIDSLAV